MVFTDKTPEYFLFSSDLRETNEIINHIQCIVAGIVGLRRK